MNPIVRELSVALPIEDAFDLFTRRIGEWWPTATHSLAGDDVIEVVFEQEAGGRVFERRADGTADWAEVVTWEPPHRFVLAWDLHPESLPPTEVEVVFRGAGGGHTTLRLEHRGWERLGSRAADLREQYQDGWAPVLERYASRVGVTS